ncbi:hypothetical protein CTI14_22550 [Methylobacterium radiotolerans]|nr:hypothetical protein CTI14_22550 [Methylobacterium radiotolerans]
MPQLNDLMLSEAAENVQIFLATNNLHYIYSLRVLLLEYHCAPGTHIAILAIAAPQFPPF